MSIKEFENTNIGGLVDKYTLPDTIPFTDYSTFRIFTLNSFYTLKTKKGEHLPVFVHSHHIHQHEKSEQFGVKSPIYIDHLVCF